MNTVLYLTPSGAAYETRAYSTADLADLIHDHGLQCLTSSDQQFDYWFSPSPRGCQRRANRLATELLLATSKFSAKNVPVLRGSVVVATHDADGDLDGLSWLQQELLVAKRQSLSKRTRRALDRRIQREDARQQRAADDAARRRRGNTLRPSANHDDLVTARS
ncbi:hypothetical protein [Mycolicibacterium agri]|uniref:Uncharacterized protein n=1 Tax=Mycolicibacterium agri TaxID=36811 RepID=A0A7I9W7A5_MYCAG|nr:hypothetical protein [Mycolicibacterium agri]GFG53575.1 hypothetical protein MAGR_50160 [Mycolicibacterium agri]